MLILVENVGVIHRDHAGGLFTQVGNGDVGCDVRTEAGETRIHQAAGFVLLVRQQGNHFLARGFVKQGQQLVAPCRSSFLDQVGGVVGREYAHPDVALFFGKAEQDNGLVMGTEVEEEIGLLAGMHFAKLF